FCKQLSSHSDIFLVGLTVLFVFPLQLVLAQDTENQNENSVNDLTRVLSANTVGEQTRIEIKTIFSIGTTDKNEMIDEIINNFSLTREDAETILQSETGETEFKEKFETLINSKQCVSQITTDLVFIIDTNDKEKILDEIVTHSQLTNRQIKQVLEFEIDGIDLDVRVQSGKARVVAEYCDVKDRFVINSADESEIISGIKSNTGLREYKIPLIWNFVTDVPIPEKKSALEEQKEQALQYGEEMFSNAAQQLEKAESAQQLVTEGGEVPPALTGGGGCLIATATYGTELAPQVQMLREIRDDSVLGTQSGAAFMSAFNSFYYSFSPAVADLERQNPMFREIVRVAITPMISTLSILNYVDIDSEYEMLGYGIGVIMMNVGMYLILPALVMFRLAKLKHTKSVT
ncbi:MAG: CFI-box-CTERM domain-containing protein, partial [Nitrosopumilaceae archaeon]